MQGFNKVIIAGNLTRDPELRYTPNGSPVCDIGVALNSVYYKGEGDAKEKVEEVTFVDVTCWGSTAENVAKFLGKGKRALIEGRLKLDQWDDKESGEKRSKLKVTADRVLFLETKSDSAGAGEDEAPTGTPGTQRPTGKKGAIPF